MGDKMKKLISCILIGMLFVLTGCGSKKDVNLEEVHNAVKEAYGDTYYPSMTYDTASIEQLFGLSGDMYDEIIAEGPMTSFQVDTFIAVKAKSGKGDAVEQALNAYRDYLINGSLQYPSNQLKIKSSKVLRKQDYVFFLLLGDIPAEVEEQGDDAILKTAEEQAQIGVKAVESFF